MSAPGAVRAAAAALALALLAAAALALAPPAAATPNRGTSGVGVTPPASSGLELDVEHLQGVVTPSIDAELAVRVRNRSGRDAERLRLLVTVHRKAFHRLDYQRAVDDGETGNLWMSVSREIGVIEGRQSASVELSRSAADLGFSDGFETHGVYPVRIQLQQDGEVLDEVRTSFVAAPDEVVNPLVGGLVLPLDVEAARRADGTYEHDRLRQDLAPQGRISEILEAAGEPQVPVTVAPSGLLLEQLAELADGFTDRSQEPARSFEADSGLARQADALLRTIRQTLTEPWVEAVALPFGRADLVALVRGGQDLEAERLLREGALSIRRHTGAGPAARTLLAVDGLDDRTLAVAARAGVRTVMVSERYLDLPGTRELPTSPAPVRRIPRPDLDDGAALDDTDALASAGALQTQRGLSTLRALVPDPWLEDLLGAGDTSANTPLLTQRILAETAAIYFERPFAERTRGVLLAPPAGWDPPQGLAGGLVDALRTAPWLRGTTLSGLIAAVDAEPGTLDLDYPPSARADELPQRYVAAIARARRDLGSLAGLLAEDDTTPTRFDRLVLAAASVHYRSRPVDGLRLLETISATVTDLYEAVAVAEGPTVLLPGSEGRIPVTLRNDAGMALRVLVRLQTPRYEFEGGPTRSVRLEPESAQTLTFEARATAPGGTYPVRVDVADAEGVQQLAEGTVVVRSTGFSVAALVVTGGAGLVFLVWVLRTVLRRLRASRAAPAGRQGETGADAPAPAASGGDREPGRGAR